MEGTTNLTSNKNKKVIIGVNYSIDSLVALFLLKKQDFEIVAVSLDMVDSAEDPFLIPPHCHGHNVKKLKEICDRFDIPLYATDARDVFQSEIRSKMLQVKAIGEHFSPCHFCGHLIIYALYQKMLKLEGDFIATGHYARVLRRNKNYLANITHSIDIKEDQSHRLAGIRQEVINKLLLPLGDLTREEVVKIYSRIFPDITDMKEEREKPCPIFNDIKGAAKGYLPKSFLRKGVVKIESEKNIIGNHEGFLDIEVGETPNKTYIKNYFGDSKKKEAIYVKGMDFNSATVFADFEPKNYNIFPCKVKRSFNDFDKSTPKEVFIKFNSEKKLYEAKLFPKGFLFVVICLKEKRLPVSLGSLMTIYAPGNKQKKVLAQGVTVGNYELEGNSENSDQETRLEFKNHYPI